MISVNEHYSLPYRLGGLLYTPALNDRFADKLIAGELGKLYSAALCLEDAILDSSVEQAELTLKSTLKKLYTHYTEGSGLPLIFVRVRSPEHLMNVHSMLGELETLLSGYILPKFDITNGQSYLEAIDKINSQNPGNEIYALPILESRRIADRQSRASELTLIKSVTDTLKSRVLGIRVGGNDFCSLYGVRRSVSQTVYDIGVVRDILTDIINVFSFDYVVSAPVWEYFGKTGEAWQTGLERELSLDLLNGFIGKTAIHPLQLPVIHKALAVSKTDYDDASEIINWSADGAGVGKSADGSRMNEVKCHRRWAQRIKMLGDIYGVIEN